MNKKDLSEAIEKGIHKGFWIPVIIIISLVLLSGIIISEINYFYKDCLETGECQMAPIDYCKPLKKLECHVVIGNTTDDFWSTGYFQICGYQEANALYEQIKPRIEEDVKEDNQKNHRNSRIKYLECN